MARRSSTTKESSGGGYQFEDQVVAWFLAHLLDRSSPVDPPGGVLLRVDVQRAASEWHLDDLVATVRTQGSECHVAFSIKSSFQITSNGFPGEFIRDAWEQLLHHSSDALNEAHDYMGLITPRAGPALTRDVFELLNLARAQDTSTLVREVQLPHRANETIRTLLQSAECPPDLAEEHSVPAGNAGRLLQRLVWLALDFEEDNSANRARGLELCRFLLGSGSQDEAVELWSRLVQSGSELRRYGGTADPRSVVSDLQPAFALKDYPDHAPDWRRLADATQSAMQEVRSTIGGTLHLPREVERKALRKGLEHRRALVLLGASGSGKSVLAKSWAETATPVLWLDATRLRSRSLGEWSSALNLDHSVRDLIETTPAESPLLVLDGIDRLSAGLDFARAAEWIRAADLDADDSRWRAILTCTPEAWAHARSRFIEQSCLPGDLEVLEIGPPDREELEEVWTAFPKLKPLRVRHNLGPVLHRPKVLDLLAVHATAQDDLSVFGESDLARLFWDREIATGPGAAARAEAARQLSLHLADAVAADISLSHLHSAVEPSSIPAIDDLVEARVLRRAEARISFDHDLYGDWVRLRQLADMDENGGLIEFLAPRLDSPVWHRALRLYGVQLLEQSSDLSPWKTALDQVHSIGPPGGHIAQDILLEAVAFGCTKGALTASQGLWPVLVADEGHLLRRLLRGLLHSATFPNPVIVGATAGQFPDLEILVAASARVPYPFYWFSIIGLLYQNRSAVPATSRGEVARVADLWLRSTPKGWPYRKEAASLAVALGEALIAEKEEAQALHYDGKTDEQVYRAVLASGAEVPEVVTQLILEAAGRRPRRFSQVTSSDEDDLTRNGRYRNLPISAVSRSTRLQPPWPHGPSFRVDGALQDCVLQGDGMRPLAEDLPEVAREMLLALLITEPRPRSYYEDNTSERLGLEWPRWYPGSYFRGPFRPFLAVAETEAVTCIIQLLEHATGRWSESLLRRRGRRESLESLAPPSIKILVAGEEKEFVGDSDVFRWSQHAPDNGGVIVSALASLEKHLYDREAEGRDNTAIINRLLSESNSLAVVGLLSVVGRHSLKYLRGPLRGLMVSPYVILWTLTDALAGASGIHFWPGWEPFPEPLQSEFRAWHEMPHRKLALRDVAVYLFLTESSLSSFFERARERMMAELRPGGQYEAWSLVENLVAQLDRDNYEPLEDENGEACFRYNPPSELLEDASDVSVAAVNQAAMTLPLACRQILDEKETVEPDEIEGLWRLVERIRSEESIGTDEFSDPKNGLAGVAAIIVRHGGEWSAKSPERAEWATKILLDVANEERGDRSLAWTSSRWDRLVFAAESLPTLWADHPEDASLRATVGRLALGAPAEVVTALASGARRVSTRLGEDHPRLLAAIIRRAHLEDGLRLATYRSSIEADDDDSTRERLRDLLQEAERNLVNRRATAELPDLSEIAPMAAQAGVGPDRRRRPAPYRAFNEQLLQAALLGIPDPPARSGLESFWESAVRYFVGPLAQPEGDETRDIDRPPGQLERYVMSRVADIVATTQDPVYSRRLWRPIVSLGASATHWVSTFARRWTAFSLFPEAEDSVVESWFEMVDQALDSPRWEPGHPGTAQSRDSGEVWRCLLGIDRLDANIWNASLDTRVGALKGRLEKWTRSHLTNLDNLRALSYLLTYPAASRLVLDGLSWIEQGAESLTEDRWNREGSVARAQEALLTLLQHVWSTQREPLRGRSSAFKAFKRLLQLLVSRQHAPAFELSERVGLSR